MTIATDPFSGRAYCHYVCAACGADLPADDTVWVDPASGRATTGTAGIPFCVSCAPDEPEEENEMATRKSKQTVTLHAPNKKALEQFRKFVAGCVEDYHDSGESPIGIYIDIGAVEEDKDG